METVILIPAYKPDAALIRVTKELHDLGFPVLVVNDGSSEEFFDTLRQAESYATVIGYETNRGKGYALRHGIEKITEFFPECRYVITADADGQHAPKDIVRVAEKLKNEGGLVLGCRHFVGEVPLRSRLGNGITRAVYAISSGVRVQDTQTGLRGMEMSMKDWLLSIEGDRYEYEMNMLMQAAKKKIPIREVTIDTIYENNNEGSHFHPFRDSIRIYSKILKYSLASILSFLLDFVLLLLLNKLFQSDIVAWKQVTAVTVATVGARIFSSALNFTLNRKIVFHHRGSLWKSLCEYYILAAVVLGVKILVLNLLHLVIPSLGIANIITETALYFLSYQVQKKLVFAAEKKKNKK